MRLEQALMLNRYCHRQLGAQSFQPLKQALSLVEEGVRGDGQSHFYHVLANLKYLSVPDGKLREYDWRVMSYQARLAGSRGTFTFKYFQYLALLYTELYLDRLTTDPSGFLDDLNAFLEVLKGTDPVVRGLAPFQADDLRRLAFFMATGSGKTLLLHVNLWQVLDYLDRGRHPDVLVRRADGARAFDSILLVTPNEGLSQQHLAECAKSGIDAALLISDRTGQRGLEPRVHLIEIHKLVEEASGEGVSIPLEELGSANLVFVDEGHKGTGSEAQTWKNRQEALSRQGFLIEYSATFAQAIGAASPRRKDLLLADYGKSILFDYSYRHFYTEGYGKDFRVLNLSRAREQHAFELLLGGLLVYYQQVRLFREHRAVYWPFQIEPPLWVFLGSSVNAVFSRDHRKKSDVATIVGFLQRFLEDSSWAVEGIKTILGGHSGFADEETGRDLFLPRLPYLQGVKSEILYKEICSRVFHGRGGLEVTELKGADGELGLRVSAPAEKTLPYFGVINIGDVTTFKRHIDESLRIQVRDDRFTGSLFGEIDHPDSPINLLIGSKKFIEGWSSWRVSTMGLLNMGKGEGPQVIQLFGRGVRLKGKGWCLKRSAASSPTGSPPTGLAEVETLSIFGWNADYIQTFRGMIEEEDLGQEVRIPVERNFDPWPMLFTPQPDSSYSAEAETWTLDVLEGLPVRVDLTPRLTALEGTTLGAGQAGQTVQIDFSQPQTSGPLDLNRLYAGLVSYKRASRYGNVFISRKVLLPILSAAILIMPARDAADPEQVEIGAATVLRTYLDRFVAFREREAESRHLVPEPLPAVHEAIPTYYTIRTSSDELLEEIKKLFKDAKELFKSVEDGTHLPRLFIEGHLFKPILLSPKGKREEDTFLSPPGLMEDEAQLLKDLKQFWAARHSQPLYAKVSVYVLRNLPKVGVGFFRRSGFYPDFLLWMYNRSAKETRLRFVEPHGLHHGGLTGNNLDKIAAFKCLNDLSREPVFRAKRISMDGYLVTGTKLEQIPGADGKTWTELREQYRVLSRGGNYMETILALD